MSNLSCPKCDSNQTSASGRGCLVWVIVICLFPVGLLALLIPRTRTCKTCDHVWKA